MSVTRDCESSTSVAARKLTAFSMYPETICIPTRKGLAGWPSTEISAAPRPFRVEITPVRVNRSSTGGAGATDATDATPDAPSKRASFACCEGSSAVSRSVLVCKKGATVVGPDIRNAQYTPLAAANIQMSAVTRRTDQLIFMHQLSSNGPRTHRRYTGLSHTARCLRRGFTLIELMVVLVIIGVLAALIVPNVLDRADDARVTAARTDINNLMLALKLYKLDNQRYPSAEQGLQALQVKPTVGPIPPRWKSYLDKLPNDPWARPYQYLNPGIRGEIDVMSLGADGQAGGEGRNADIGSWE